MIVSSSKLPNSLHFPIGLALLWTFQVENREQGQPLRRAGFQQFLADELGCFLALKAWNSGGSARMAHNERTAGQAGLKSYLCSDAGRSFRQKKSAPDSARFFSE
ncbi:MAG: hypothetical protein DMG90_05950 [Acidobacteria bacterium]|nr:MAG: hypothetical protein DMG90_05950 [Acidobacteriota bacterium]